MSLSFGGIFNQLTSGIVELMNYNSGIIMRQQGMLGSRKVILSSNLVLNLHERHHFFGNALTQIDSGMR